MLKKKPQNTHIIYSYQFIIKSTIPTTALPFSSSSVCFERLRFLYTSCFVGSYQYEGMELALADISFLALETGSVTAVFPLPCVACSLKVRVRMSPETPFIVLLYYDIVVLCDRTLNYF